MPKRKRLLWQLYPSYLIITLISLFAVTWYASSALRNFYFKQVASDLEEQARLFESQVFQYLDPLDEKTIDNICKRAGSRSTTRITVILPSGRVVGDSDEDPAGMDTHLDRPEFIDAVKKASGVSKRYSRTIDKNLLYVGIPLTRDEEIIAVIRTATPVGNIDSTISGIQIRIAAAGVIIALIAAAISLFVSRRITYPLEQIKLWAKSIASGESRSRPPILPSEEIEELYITLDQMAVELRERIGTITRQRNQIEAVLSSMVEAVIAVDNSERIIRTNNAAGRMFEFDPAQVNGRILQEIIRNAALHRFVKDSLASENPVDRDIIPTIGEHRILNARGSTLRDAEGKRIGALIVLNDVSRLRVLENIRKEFAANVSHEIQTPLTAIKGFVETLLEGRVENREDIERFLGIVSKHVDRLQTIIEDLLSLSRIEKEAEKNEIRLVNTQLFDVLLSAVQLCQIKADEKNITLNISCSKDLTANLDSHLFEQALINLLDNAIKYSDDKGVVKISCEATSQIDISISDKGCGIEKRHLPRLFERFYRVDKARSRRLGGTGLGLAIVKHIVQSHGGGITVESSPGVGSTFTIHLPKPI